MGLGLGERVGLGLGEGVGRGEGGDKEEVVELGGGEDRGK